MAQPPRPTSLLSSLGEEIIRIITPVSICMLLVVLLVSVLTTTDPSNSTSSLSTIATIAYTEPTSDSQWTKIKGALLNSLVFVVVVTAVTFLLVLLFYFRCTSFLKYYMGFSAFLVLGFMGGEIGLFLIQVFRIGVDCFTYGLLLFNVTVVGVLAVFVSKMAIFVTQSYLVLIGVFTAYWFTMLPEWTTWVLLVAMALYDLAAVLLPGGPLRLLVELAMSRDEDIPALVYEARPVIVDSHLVRRRTWRNIQDSNLNSSSLGNGQNVIRTENLEEGRASELLEPFIERGSGEGRNTRDSNSNVDPLGNGQNVIRVENLEEVRVSELREQLSEHGSGEGIGLGSSGAIKLGLGDFIFYSVLVGRAAMYDFMTVYACYLAIIAGLGITLVLLALYQKALPALPVSVMLGVLFYLLTRLLLEEFVVQCSINLVMF